MFGFFECEFLKVFQGWLGWVKGLLQSKSEELHIFKAFFTFPKETDKNSKFKLFTGSSLTPWTPEAAGRSSKCCRRWNCFEENWMKFLKMLVLTLISSEILKCCLLKLRVFFFFKHQFFKVIRDWMGYVKALLWSKSKKLNIFKSFLIFPKEIEKKNSNFKTFTGSSLIVWGQHAPASGTMVYSGWRPLWCTQVRRGSKNQPVLKKIE